MDLTTRVGLDKIVNDVRQGLSFYFNSATLGDYIIAWSRFEEATMLAERRERTLMQYRNYPREIIRKYIEGLQRRQDSIIRKSKDADFQKFLDGWYDSWFWREVVPMAILLPELYVQLIPTNDGGWRPAVVFPQYVTTFEMDPNLDLVNIQMRLDAMGKRMMLLNAESSLYYFSSNDKDGKTMWWPENEGEPTYHNLGFCPVVRAAYEENVEIATLEGTPAGHSFMYATIMMTQADLQFRSMLAEASYDHLHYQVAMTDATAKRTGMQGFGSMMPFIETVEDRGSTRYVSKPSFEMETLRKIIGEDNPKEIFESARLQGRFSNSAQTGAARMADLYPENGVLTNLAGYLWDLDERILNMLARALKVDVSVRWPTIFDTRGPAEVLQDANLMLGMAPKLPVSESAIKEMTKNLQHIVNPGVPTGLLNIFDKETDRAPIPFLPPPPSQGSQTDDRSAAGNQGDGAISPQSIPPAGPQAAGGGEGNAPIAARDGGGDETLEADQRGSGLDALRDGGSGAVPGATDREVASPMALAFVVNCAPGKEEEEYDQILEALEEAEYEVTFINLNDSLDKLHQLDDSIFIWNGVEGFHDKAQFEMHVASYFELHGFRFTGSGAKTLGLLQDKALTKTILAGVGCLVKPAVLIKRGVDIPDMSYLAWPRMVKPAAEDASTGIRHDNKVHNDDELKRVIARLFTITDSILVEEFIEGREILASVLGNGTERVMLPPMEIEFEGDTKFVTKDAKQNSDSKDFNQVVSKDATLTEAERAAIEQTVLTACRALEIRDYARVDLRLTADGQPWIVEVNPNPDLSPDHGFGGSAQLAGIKFPELIDRIVRIAQNRYEMRGA